MDYTFYALREIGSGLLSGDDVEFPNGKTYPVVIAYAVREEAEAELEQEGLVGLWEVVKAQIVFPDDVGEREIDPLDTLQAEDEGDFYELDDPWNA